MTVNDIPLKNSKTRNFQKKNRFLLFYIDSYIEISRFYQGYIDNEINLNAEGTCRQKCSDYVHTKHYHCAENSFCSETLEPWAKSKLICNGAVYNCQYFDADLNLCPAVSVS